MPNRLSVFTSSRKPYLIDKRRWGGFPLSNANRGARNSGIGLRHVYGVLCGVLLVVTV